MQFRSIASIFVVCLTASVAGCSGGEGDNDGGSADTISTVDLGPDATDGGMGRDADNGDATDEDGSTEDTGTNNFPTLSDYRTCRSDTDCPVGLGACVKAANFNRPDNGVSEISIESLFDGLAAGEGVCSRGCTTDVTSCDTLSLRNGQGDTVPFTCQVVAVGVSPYPDPAPAFPFDTLLDNTEMTAGRPFAAICRPPFELDEVHINNFCGACTGAADCDDGTCWRFDTNAVATSSQAGTCLEPAPPSGCPFGFTASDLGGLGMHCVPDTDTCGPCRDRDDDGRGAGHCVSTAVDCDDTNASAYFDELDPEHAFPTFCGNFDYNCNGLSDDGEQVGVEAYEAFHCEACGDDFDGQTVNAGTPAEAVLECANGTMQVASCADATRINCSGDPRVVGCDSTLAMGGQTYFRDMDGDTFGDPNITSLGCPAGPPSGFVANSDDCDDTTDLIRPGVPDICECWGDCDQPGAQVDNDCDNSFDEDVTNYTWYADDDVDGAGGQRISATQYCGQPVAGSVPHPTVTGNSGGDCSDVRAFSFGTHDRIADAAGVALPLPVNSAPPRDANGELYFVTTAANPEVCDGFDNDCVSGVDNGVTTRYYRDFDTDTYGNPNSFRDECSQPAGYVADNTDCNDANISINPAAMEICNNVDDNCINGADEGVPLGGTCTVAGETGLCAMGTETACVGGNYTCSPIDPNAPLAFDDPATTVDEDCDGAEVIVYVDPTAPTTTNGRTPATAVRDIATALIRAAENPPATQIHLLGGTMNTIDDQVTLRNGVDIVGGGIAGTAQADPWTYDATRSGVMRTGGNTAAGREVAFFANNVSATLARMNILVASPTDGATGIDIYGLALRGNGLVRLRELDLTINTGLPGGDGTDGVVGQTGAPGAGLAPGVGFCGSVNVSGGPVAFDAGPAQDGLGPSGGGRGANFGILAGDGSLASGGAAGSTALPRVSSNWWNAEVGTNAPGLGQHGSGGGGGFGISSIPWFPGGGGGGGCAGTRATHGRNGGSAFGIFSIASNFELIQPVTITVNGAGDGGDGGNGSNGGNGGAGGQGVEPNGTPPPTRFHDGGDGSGGGGGGGGAGGDGGDTYPIFQSGGSDPCDNADVLLSNLVLPSGVGGTGGDGGSRGTGGQRGSNGTRSVNGTAGLNGYNGQNADCFWSRPCTTNAQCPTGQGCASGRCYFNRVRAP